MPNCCIKHKDNMNMMSDVEASLRAKLLLKCAELSDLRQEHDNLKEKFEEQKNKADEYLDHIDEMHLKMYYYIGKISAYQDILREMKHA